MTHVTGRFENEPADSYHAKREYISSSPLAQMAKSPMHFHNAWTTPVEPTDAMDKGTFMHSLLLEQDIERFAPRPMKDGRLVASNTKDYAAWAASIGNATPIHPDLYNEAMAILTAACTNATFIKAFNASDKEVSYYGTHKATGLPIKARPDMIARDGSFILDVKSTADIMKFERQLFSLAYDIRLIHYVKTIESVTEKPIENIYFFAIESKSPYASKTFRLSKKAIEDGSALHESWMNQVAVCKAENIWPGFDESIVELDRPAYLEIETVSFGEDV